jgi:hypothetical protein
MKPPPISAFVFLTIGWSFGAIGLALAIEKENPDFSHASFVLAIIISVLVWVVYRAFVDTK